LNQLLRTIDDFDKKAALASARIRSRPLTGFLVFITYSGSGAVWFPLAIVLVALLRAGFREHGLVTFLAAMAGALLSLVLGELLKLIVRRPRPYDAMPEHTTATRRPTDKSMPSTHASTAVALLVGLLVAGHPWAWFVLPWSLLVPFSRYYLGVHYPTDLLAGAALGAAFGLLDWTWLVEALVL